MLSSESFPLTSAVKTDNNNNNNNNNYGGIYSSSSPPSEASSSSSSSLGGTHDRTTTFQTFVHLLKGYMGAGCLSLPWAVSQLGMVYGPLAILLVSIWSSYNCWTVVQLKRYIQVETNYLEEKDNNNNRDAKSDASSSVTTANTNITYPDVGDWAYGASFHTYVSVSLCTQQLAICTVFISFVGENLLAVLEYYNLTNSPWATHSGVMTVILPAILGLSMIPNLKLLAPVMAAGTGFLIVCFIAIGVIVIQEWEHRPDEFPTVNLPQVPLAICAILYSYEGINLILPVESAMKEPKDFQKVFWAAMACVAAILATFSIVCVWTFGFVDSGSVTAFLLEAYRGDPTIIGWLMVANTAVSISVLVTYPLQLFPAIELLAPSISKCLSPFDCSSCGGGGGTELDDEDGDSLSGFEPLPPLPEHERADWGDEDLEFHKYDEENNDDQKIDEDSVGGRDSTNATSIDAVDADASSVAHSALTSVRSILVLPKMTMPGDSILVRLFLVVMTYMVAVIVPNVQALISLAGAVAGSSSALLIPPFLELAWIQHLESDTTVAAAVVGVDIRDEGNPILRSLGLGKYAMDRFKCYLLLAFGFLFFGIGTYASLADIVDIYLGSEESS